MQTIRDGKSIIIEGLHLDPGLYLYEFGKYGIRHLHTRNDSMLPSQASTGQQEDPVLVEPVNPEPLNPDKDVQKGAQLQPDDRFVYTRHLLSLTFSRLLTCVINIHGCVTALLLGVQQSEELFVSDPASHCLFQ